ncbi:putative chaperone DnaJ, HSP40/DnaJ peptide-binding protein [Helianthus debilis subsp. tardiflorus]
MEASCHVYFFLLGSFKELAVNTLDVYCRNRVGDLYLVLHVNQKRGIRREGLHLYSDITIDYSQAILGTVIKVETAEGLKDLHVPSGVQPGETIKLSKMGVPDVNKPSVRGHHHFIVNVQIPKYIR